MFLAHTDGAENTDFFEHEFHEYVYLPQRAQRAQRGEKKNVNELPEDMRPHCMR